MFPRAAARLWLSCLRLPAPPRLGEVQVEAIIHPVMMTGRFILPWLGCAVVALLLLRSSTQAFRLSISPAESSRQVDRKDLGAHLATDLTCSKQIESPPPQQDWDGDGSEPLLDAGTSREKFLRDVVGVGVGVAAGISYDPQPAHALFEDFNNAGKCPKYEAVRNFDVDKYMGIWYELAYHDWTQIKICGCTRFNMTRTDTRIKDAFTTKCPYEADVGETFLINMREAVNFKTPGSFQEYAFYNKWDNKVVALWRSVDTLEGERYERAIQMQCVEMWGRRAFVGINFLSRTPFVSPRELADMFDKARGLGLAGIGGNPAEMEVVRHAGCRYPTSSGSAERRSWGSAWGVNTVQL